MQFEAGQRVMTPDGPGKVTGQSASFAGGRWIPLQRYGVKLDKGAPRGKDTGREGLVTYSTHELKALAEGQQA